jgi:CNT family concentrative nucleoside transporter
LGVFAFLAVAWAFSSDRGRTPWRVVGTALAIQWAIAIIVLHTPVGDGFFIRMNAVVAGLLAFTSAGSEFVFGNLLDGGFSFVLRVLPIIIFMGSLFSILYHIGLTQWVVRGLAILLSRALGTSGAESLAAIANVFVGMTEAPLLIRPYIERMTHSELFTLMVTGMATIAGSVLVAYAEMLGEGSFSGHLVTASLLSAPAAIAMAKIMIPETGTPETGVGVSAHAERRTVNVIDAAAEGALTALRLAANVGALLLAFVALVAMLNAGIGWLGELFGFAGLTFEGILGWLFAPVAWLLGIPWSEATEIGSLLGIKTVLNEFLAYEALSELMKTGAVSDRSAVIAAYALCGFANLGSIAILLGGVGGLVPSRRSELAQLGLRSVLAGTLATLMTGAVVGTLL